LDDSWLGPPNNEKSGGLKFHLQNGKESYLSSEVINVEGLIIHFFSSGVRLFHDEFSVEPKNFSRKKTSKTTG
jgi:hypothetical protein